MFLITQKPLKIYSFHGLDVAILNNVNANDNNFVYFFVKKIA